jgi:hypothetical protein
MSEGEIMTIIREALLSTAFNLLAIAGALGQAAAPPGQPTGSVRPADLQHNCLLKTLNTCKANASCVSTDNLKGEKLPLKMTVDIAAGIVAGVDPNGWINATRIASLAQTDDEIILQGIDSAVAWQVLIYEKNEVMSFSLATADGASIGFGECTGVTEP